VSLNFADLLFRQLIRILLGTYLTAFDAQALKWTLELHDMDRFSCRGSCTAKIVSQSAKLMIRLFPKELFVTALPETASARF
jgi:hypothetical protein